MVTRLIEGFRRLTRNDQAVSDGAFVYLLACADSSLYCGWTTDLERRLAAHSAGRGGAYTRTRLPVRYAAAWSCASRTEARSLEARIKRLPRAGKLALLAGGPMPGDAQPRRASTLSRT